MRQHFPEGVAGERQEEIHPCRVRVCGENLGIGTKGKRNARMFRG